MTKKMNESSTAGAASALSRRSVILGAASTSAVAFAKAHGMDAHAALDTSLDAYRADHDLNDVVQREVHEGKGKIGMKFFRFDGATQPAVLLIYTIPPGASEGVHVHRPGDHKLGSFDEFYYILEGQGEMEIAGSKVPVKPGDHIFTPNGVAHGIENTASEGDLKVYLVAMRRA